MADPARIWIPYCGAAPVPAEILARWNLDPLLLGAMGVAGAGYLAWRRLGGRGDDLCAGGALALLVLVFVSPLCALSSALFSARVLHHALMITAIAPLTAWTFPAGRLPGRQGRGLPLSAATALHAALLWTWHAPGAYAFALSHDGGYWLMQACLLGSAVLFWRAVRRAPAPAAVAGLLATLVQTGLLGALITFAAAPLYAPHLAATAAWGLAPLQDQQLAGLIMWAPMAGLYLLAALAILGRWMGREAGAPAAAS